MRNFWKIIKILFVAVATNGAWEGLESGDYYRVAFNVVAGSYWLSQIWR